MANPATGNDLLRPAMLVSGSCIASGTTVNALPSAVVRQGELLPGLPLAAFWTANTVYAVGQTTTNGGNVYTVTAVTGNAQSAASGGPTGTSATNTVQDNNVTWLYTRTANTWVASTAYTAGQVRVNGGNFYIVATGGISGSTGPTGTTPGMDGSVTWTYLAAISATPEVMWSSGMAVVAGQIVWANGGHWIARASGTTGATAPGSNSNSGTEAFTPTISASSSDGAVNWAWLLPAEYANLPTGAVTLSTASSSCPVAVGTGTVNVGSSNNTITSASASSGSFFVGGTVLGANIPSGMTVTAISGSTLTLSQAFNFSGTESFTEGSTITFTIAPSQLQALTLDWLGIQTALADAFQNPYGSGGQVYLPAGLYEVNHPLMNAGQTGNTSSGLTNIAVHGDGAALSQILFSADLGQDECAMAESNRSPGSNSLNIYSDFALLGQGSYTAVNGVSPNKMDGLCVGETARAYRMTIHNMRAAVNLIDDHQIFHDMSLNSNGYGYFFAPYSNSVGNQQMEGGAAFSYIAGFGIASTNQFDSGMVTNVHTGFGPYGFYSLPSTPNVTVTDGNAVSNSVLTGVWTESIGKAWMAGSQPNSQFNGNTLITVDGGMVNNALYSLSNGVGGTIQPRAEVDVAEFIGNTMLGTSMAPYAVVSDAVIEASGAGGCSNNQWTDDSSFVNNATLAVPMIKCLYNTGGNMFKNATGDGIIVPFTTAVTAYEPVGDSGNLYGPYIEGKGFAGIAAAPVAANNAGPVVTHSVGITVSTATSTQTITRGTPVFVTGYPNPGVVPAIDPSWAIGTVQVSGTGSVGVALEPLESKGAPMGDMSETPGTGTNCYSIKSPITDFTQAVTSGCVTLAITPIGKAQTISNDTANPITINAPSSFSLLPGSATMLAAGASGTYYRFGQLVYR